MPAARALPPSALCSVASAFSSSCVLPMRESRDAFGGASLKPRVLTAVS
jgi:hypothetical protein